MSNSDSEVTKGSSTKPITRQDTKSKTNIKDTIRVNMADNSEMVSVIKLFTEKLNEISVASTNNVEDTVPEFDGELNVDTWLQNFENNAQAYGWSEQQKYVFAMKKVVKTAKVFLQSVSISNYSELKKELLKEFGREYKSIEIHELLKNKKKRKDESFSEYMMNMRQLGKLGHVDDLSIIQYIVDGINGRAQLKIGLYGARTFAELKRQYVIFERVEQETKTQYDNKSKFDFNKKKREHCFNCGATDHKRPECRSSAPKCFKCGKLGHISRNCTENKNVETNINCIQKNMFKAGVINNVEVMFFVDTGAEVSLMKNSLYEDKFKSSKLQRCTTQLVGLGGTLTATIGCFMGKLELDGVACNQKFFVVNDAASKYDIILGYDAMNEYRFISDENGYHFEALRPSSNTIDQEEKFIVNIATVLEEEDNIIVPEKYKHKIKKLKNDYSPKATRETPIKMRIVPMKAEPISTRPYRLPIIHEQIIEEHINKLLQNKIIKPSFSEYCSNVVLANKKDGSKRFCVDYRKLNKIVFKDNFPVIEMEEVIDKLSDSKVFSTIDIENAFFHVPIEEESKKYTAFITKQGLFEFNYAPFGFCNSPAYFIRYINYIFSDLVKQSVMEMYVDDIIIYAKDEEENLLKLEKVLEVAATYGLKIKWKKAKFLQHEIEFLGLVIKDGSIKPNEEKLLAIKKFPEPKNLKALQSFLGLTGYFRKFVKNYSIIARPLTELLKKNVVFSIGSVEKDAVSTLKQLLIAEPVLKIFSPNKRIQLHTDASKYGFGAVLLQEYDNGNFPVYYWSKKTSEAESKQHSYVLETKAAYLAMKKMRHYLLGRKFSLVTDCASFKYTNEKKTITDSVARYILDMQDYEFTIEHRSGERMRHVDALSRNTVLIIQAEDETTCRLRKAQEKDEHISAIKEILNTKPFENYVVIRGILYKNMNGLNLLVVPRQMEKEVITKIHEEGHYGVQKTMHQLQQHFYIPHAERKTTNIIKNCVKCIIHNKKKGKLEGFLNCIDKGETPLETIHVDHLGPMDATSKQYKYIFAMVDGFTKFVWLYPTKCTGVEEVVRKLTEWSLVFGFPRRLISDRGPAFTSNNFEEFVRGNGIEHIMTTTGVPRGNGQIERVNQTILSVISKLSTNDPSKWYKFVPQVQRCINANMHSSTQRSPFELMFGIKIRNNEDAKLIEILEEERIASFENDRNELRKLARKNIISAQQQYKKNYDKKRKDDTQYNKGDLVAIKRTQFVAGRKLASQYMGPYEVTKVKRNGRYDVTRMTDGEGPKSTSTCSDYMKPWVSYEDRSSAGSDDEDQDGRM